MLSLGARPVFVAVHGEFNLLESDVTVNTVTIDNASYSALAPTLPVTVAAGESIAVSLSFEPTPSGVDLAVLSITIEGVAQPFVLNLTGEGNYPPAAADAVVVSGAGDADANGVYHHNGTLNNSFDAGAISYCGKPDTGHRLFGDNVEGVWWYLDASADGSDIRYEIDYMGPTGPTVIPLGEVWYAVNGTGPAPTSVGPFTLQNPGYVAIGDTITGNSGLYLMLEVTPHAESGTLGGEPVLIGPTPLIAPPQG